MPCKMNAQPRLTSCCFLYAALPLCLPYFWGLQWVCVCEGEASGSPQGKMQLQKYSICSHIATHILFKKKKGNANAKASLVACGQFVWFAHAQFSRQLNDFLIGHKKKLRESIPNFDSLFKYLWSVALRSFITYVYPERKQEKPTQCKWLWVGMEWNYYNFCYIYNINLVEGKVYFIRKFLHKLQLT